VSDRAHRDRERQPSDEELEELGDDVIIAQETGAHAPQRRVNVTTDHPSVVISEPPRAYSTSATPPQRARRERMEQTVVIRDRKQLERMRRDMTRQHRKKRGVEKRTMYLVAIAAVASLAMGTLIAALVDSSTEASPVPIRVLPAPEPAPGAPAPSGTPPSTIDLDALPATGNGARRSDSP
jgi:hypothetical protein